MVEELLKVARIGSEWVLYLLLGLSVISIGVMIERFLAFRALRDVGDGGAGVRVKLSSAIRAGNLAEVDRVLSTSKTIEARVVKQALTWRHGGPRAVSDALESELLVARQELERGTNFLGTLGNNAPFIGLFGTVLGVIEAFHQLAGGANKEAMGNVMSGIAEALIATGVGLFVALPAVIAYNIAQKKIGDIESRTGALGKLVTAYLEAGKVPAERDTTERADAPHETRLVVVGGD